MEGVIDNLADKSALNFRLTLRHKCLRFDIQF